MNGIDYDKSLEYINRNSKVVRYGKYTEDIDDETNQLETNVITSINENTFYTIYLQLNNVIRYKSKGTEVIDFKISDTPIQLLTHLMCKGTDSTIIYRNKDKKNIELAKELDRTPSSILTSISKLKKAGYLNVSEDRILVLNEELTDLVNKTKLHIKLNEPLKFDFLFKLKFKTVFLKKIGTRVKSVGH